MHAVYQVIMHRFKIFNYTPNHTKHHFFIILYIHKWYFYPRLHYSQKKELHFHHSIKGIFCTNAHFEDGHEPSYVDGMELLSVTVKRNSPSTNESSHYLGKIIVSFEYRQNVYLKSNNLQ